MAATLKSRFGIATAAVAALGSWLSEFEVGKEYHVRYYTKEEFDIRVIGQTGGKYLIRLKGSSSIGSAGEEVSVEQRLLKLLKEI